MKTHPQRVHKRYTVLLQIEVEAPGVGRRAASIHDVSKGGGFLEDFPLSRVGTHVTTFFNLPDGKKAALSAEVRNVRFEGGAVQGMGVAWLIAEDSERAFVLELIAKAQEVQTRLPRLSERSRGRYALGTTAVLASFGLSMYAERLLPNAGALRLARTSKWSLGIAAAVLVCSSLVLALRRRGMTGLRGRGGYDVWLSAHILLVDLGLILSSFHVLGRRGGGAALACALCTAMIPLSGLPGILFWKRKARSRFGARLQRHWLKVHVALIAPFLIALGWHVFQVAYY